MSTLAPRPRKGRRTGNACDPCRQSKIKCSGENPCATCTRRVIKCYFSDDGHKVQVTKRFLTELKRRANRASQQHQSREREQDSQASLNLGNGSLNDDSTEPAPISVDGLGNDDVSGACPPGPPGVHESSESLNSGPEHTLSVWTSPFTAPSVIIKNTFNNRRGWVWLAPSSNWSFAVRLIVMITEHLGLPSPFTESTFMDRNTYADPLKSYQNPWNSLPDTSGLPSLDHALYLFSTVRFHLGQNYRLIDEEDFLENLYELYNGNVDDKVASNRLWFIQYLLIMAFGKAFLGQTKNPNDPPGCEFFERALGLMPNLTTVWKDSLLGMEVLALIGLYLYSMDQREAAQLYISQAVWIARMEGLHTQLPEADLGSSTVSRCRNLWWTLYIIEHHLATSMSLNCAASNEDIDTLICKQDLMSDHAALGLQVKLSRMLSYILNTIYRSEKISLARFLETTRTILHSMAGHAQEIEQFMQHRSQATIKTMPKGTRHISLLYHQCVLMATRPLLLSILKERLEKLGSAIENWESFMSVTTTLISTGIKSAVKTLQILSYDDSLLQIFLPFDLEFVYTAALHLIMANSLFPGIPDGKAYRKAAYDIFDEMINKGNKVAEGRKQELVHIEELFYQLSTRVEWRRLEPLTVTVPDEIILPNTPVSQPLPDTHTQESPSASCAIEDAEPTHADTMAPPNSAVFSVFDPQPPENADYLDSVGISSCEFLSIIDEMGSYEFLDYGLPNDVDGWESGQISET